MSYVAIKKEFHVTHTHGNNEKKRVWIESVSPLIAKNVRLFY